MVAISSLDTAHVSAVKREARVYDLTIASFQRPANATAYAAGDVISDDASTAKAIEFKGCAKRNGGSGALLHPHIIIDENMAVVPNLELYIFDVEPTNHADNAALALADTDRPIAVLSFAALDAKVLNASASPAGLIIMETQNNAAAAPITVTPRAFVCAADSTSLWGLLVTRSAFTPVSGTKFTIEIELEKD